MQIITKKTFAVFGFAAVLVAFGCQKSATDSNASAEKAPGAVAPTDGKAEENAVEETSSETIDAAEDAAVSDETLQIQFDMLLSTLSNDAAENVGTLEKARAILDRMKAPTPRDALLAAETSIRAEGLLGSVENLEKLTLWAAEKIENASDETLNPEAIKLISERVAYLFDLIHESPSGPPAAKKFLERVVGRIERSKSAKNQDGLTTQALVALGWCDAYNSLLLKEYDEAAVKVDAVEKFFREQNKEPETALALKEELKRQTEELARELEANKDKLSPEQYEEMRKLIDDSDEETSLVDAFAAAHFGHLRALAAHFNGRTEEAKELFEFGVECDLEVAQGMFSKNLYLLLETLRARGSDVSGLTYLRDALETRFKEEFGKGIGITQVVADSQGAKLGVTTNDRLLKYDGWFVTDARTFVNQRWGDVAHKTERDVEVEFLIDGTPKTFTVKAGLLGIGLDANE